LSHSSDRKLRGSSRPSPERTVADDSVARSSADGRQVEAFAAIYERWFASVYRWVRLLGATEADADDLVQEVFVVVFRRLPDFDGRNLPGWLYRITRRRVRDHRHLVWVKDVLRAGDMSSMSALRHTQVGPDGDLDRREREQLLDQLLSSLKDDQRVAFVLFEIEGWSGEEIAALQNVPLNTIWARIYRARRHLQKKARTQKG
jgi:RNA polymerase sigma-70 factor, ECF subfamily